MLFNSLLAFTRIDRTVRYKYGINDVYCKLLTWLGNDFVKAKCLRSRLILAAKMEQNGLYFTKIWVLKTAISACLSITARDVFYRIVMSSNFLQRRAETHKIAANLVLLLNFFRLSKGQFYSSDEAALAEQHRHNAEQSTVEWTNCEVCEIWCSD